MVFKREGEIVAHCTSIIERDGPMPADTLRANLKEHYYKKHFSLTTYELTHILTQRNVGRNRFLKVKSKRPVSGLGSYPLIYYLPGQDVSWWLRQ